MINQVGKVASALVSYMRIVRTRRWDEHRGGRLQEKTLARELLSASLRRLRYFPLLSGGHPKGRGIDRRRMVARRKRAGNLTRLYTIGELNKTVDALLHPLAEVDPAFLILDGVVHSIIEQNPPESVMKFIHHNLPKLAWQLMRGRRRK